MPWLWLDVCAMAGLDVCVIAGLDPCVIIGLDPIISDLGFPRRSAGMTLVLRGNDIGVTRE